jgi:hypothetical protein
VRLKTQVHRLEEMLQKKDKQIEEIVKAKVIMEVGFSIAERTQQQRSIPAVDEEEFTRNSFQETTYAFQTCLFVQKSRLFLNFFLFGLRVQLVQSLKQRILALEENLQKRDEAILKLKTRLRGSRINELEQKVEIFYLEVRRQHCVFFF